MATIFFKILIFDKITEDYPHTTIVIVSGCRHFERSADGTKPRKDGTRYVVAGRGNPYGGRLVRTVGDAGPDQGGMQSVAPGKHFTIKNPGGSTDPPGHSVRGQ